jgi:hypothetical protein
MGEEQPSQAEAPRWGKPMPAQRVTLPWRRTFSAEDWKKIGEGRNGANIRSEGQWVIYVEDGMIHFHRRWSGFCVFQVVVKPEGDGMAAEAIIANRDMDEYRSDDPAYDVALVEYLIDFLLGKDLVCPQPSRNQ